MAITNQLILTRLAGSSDIIAYPKNLDLNNPVWTETLYAPVMAWVFDSDRDTLWCTFSDKKLKKYTVSDTGLSEIQDITMTYKTALCSSMTIDPTTGNLYITDTENHNITYKILFNGTAIDASSQLATAHFSSSTSIVGTPGINQVFGFDSWVPGSLLWDPRKNNLVLCSTLKGTSPYNIYPTFIELKPDLSDYESITWQNRITVNDDIRPKNYSHYQPLGDTENHVMSYSEVTGDIAYSVDSMIQTYYGTYNKVLIRSASGDFVFELPIDPNNLTSGQVEYGSGAYFGKYTGNLYAFKNGIITVYSPSYKHINTRTILSNLNIISFNNITDDIFIFTDSSNSLSMYDKNLTEIKTVNFSAQMAKLLVIPGTNDHPSNAVSPSTIVFPSIDSSIADDTPTIIWEMGTNPTGWTQQFRVVADTNANTVIDGGPASTYLRKFDSWTNGSDYADCTWEYSTDYVSGNDPSTGTWTALGTADGLKAGGTNITNGLDSGQGNYFIRMTIPVGSELTGGSTNTKWHFNIFSYSA